MKSSESSEIFKVKLRWSKSSQRIQRVEFLVNFIIIGGYQKKYENDYQCLIHCESSFRNVRGRIKMKSVTVCFCHVTYPFHSESTLYGSSGFESSCSHLNFRFRACFEQEVLWHWGNYGVWIHTETRKWHDKNIKSNASYR